MSPGIGSPLFLSHASPQAVAVAPVIHARRAAHVPQRRIADTRHDALLIAEVIRTPDDTPLDRSLGEFLLSMYATRLGLAVRHGDTVTNIGPLTIGLICPGVADWQALGGLLDRLRRATSPLLPLPDHDGYATISITAVLTDDATRNLRALQEPTPA